MALERNGQLAADRRGAYPKAETDGITLLTNGRAEQ